LRAGKNGKAGKKRAKVICGVEEPETRNQEPETRNPKPETGNLKLKTQNLKHTAHN